MEQRRIVLDGDEAAQHADKGHFSGKPDRRTELPGRAARGPTSSSCPRSKPSGTKRYCSGLPTPRSSSSSRYLGAHRYEQVGSPGQKAFHFQKASSLGAAEISFEDMAVEGVHKPGAGMAVAGTKGGQAPDGAGLGHVGMQQTGAGLTQQRPDRESRARKSAPGRMGRTSGTRRTGTAGSVSSPSSRPGRPVARTTVSSWPRDLAKRRTWRAGPPMFMRVVKRRHRWGAAFATGVAVTLRGAAGPVHGHDRNKNMSRSSISLTVYPGSTRPRAGGWGWWLTVEWDGPVGLDVGEGRWAGELWGCRAGAWHCSNLS